MALFKYHKQDTATFSNTTPLCSYVSIAILTLTVSAVQLLTYTPPSTYFDVLRSDNTHNFFDDVIHWLGATTKFKFHLYAWCGAKPPNLKTSNISVIRYNIEVAESVGT